LATVQLSNFSQRKC